MGVPDEKLSRIIGVVKKNPGRTEWMSHFHVDSVGDLSTSPASGSLGSMVLLDLRKGLRFRRITGDGGIKAFNSG